MRVFPCGLRPPIFFSEKGVSPKIHPSFSLTEETKPFKMAKPVWGAGKTILLEYFGVSTKAYQPAVGPIEERVGKNTAQKSVGTIDKQSFGHL